MCTEILTDNKKEYGSTDRRRVEGNSEDAERRPDTRRTGDVQKIYGETSESGDRDGLENPKGTELQSVQERILDEVVALEVNLVVR